jgi:hypothetical protein
MKSKLILLFCLALTSATASANCDFKTGEYIKELSNPAAISLIEIEVPQSAKFAKNFLKTILSRTPTIPAKLKRRFKAEITVHYDFGVCSYKGAVRQSGDFRDHISTTSDGKPLRSLDVKLSSGNIMSAVRFKLLIPETRKGAPEILGALLLRQAGYLSPETFEVNTLVNGASAVMLFQENAEKELLEKNLRREGPIFEGDEELIWGYQEYDNLELLPLALARMVNDKWLLKGSASEEISIAAFERLQLAYLTQASPHMDKMSNWWRGRVIDPNNGSHDDFAEYAFLVLAMNGYHALAPNNRRFYYNSLAMQFEPIYYDGNLNFQSLEDTANWSASNYLKMLNLGMRDLNTQRLLKRVEEILDSRGLKARFLNRIDTLEKDADAFYDESIAGYRRNLGALKGLLEIATQSAQQGVAQVPLSDSMDRYLSFQSSKQLNQRVVTTLDRVPGSVTAFASSIGGERFSPQQVAKLLSKNEIGGERAIYIPLKGDSSRAQRSTAAIKSLNENFPGSVYHSAGMTITYDSDQKLLSLKQANMGDWAVITGAQLSGWRINFAGVDGDLRPSETSQRFNEFGLTGCVTIFDSRLSDVSFKGSGGGCEDGLNIVSAMGHISLIDIRNAYADALDMDFSNLVIDQIQVSNAGNDCVDVSGGEYSVSTTRLRNCGDKGVSIGEKSVVNLSEVKLSGALIGVSTKDYSKAAVGSSEMSEVQLCAEVMQKKQEFGGATLSIETLSCDAEIFVDNNSLFDRQRL